MSELPLVIDCQTCVARLTDACADCIVTFLCDAPADQPVVVDASEARVLRLLQDGGLVPGVKHKRAS
ncbi:MAG TPA: hypothetical protein VMZ22_11125 [Acidimicrobiales bacterium]|nr:hypothetical protein [Acidimicrobiales bacterium]